MNKHLKTASVLAHILDNQFKILGLSFGVSALIDLIPGFGDGLDALLSFYIVWIGLRMGIPRLKILQMILNIVVNFLVGSIPILGDLIYLVNKVNLKNLQILQEFS